MDKKLKVALDIDGVLANFYLTVCKKFKKPYVTVKQFKIEWLKFNKIANDSNFWQTLEVLNPPEAITFDFDIYMTSMPGTMMAARSYWLGYNHFPKKAIVITHKKADACKEMEIDVLIDDKVDTIRECVLMKQKCIQYIPYYSGMNNVHGKGVKHLPEINEILELFSKWTNIEKSLPKEVQDKLYESYWELPREPFVNLLNLTNQIYNECKNGDELFRKVSRWQVFNVMAYKPCMFTEKLLGEDKHYNIMLLREEAKGSM